MGEYFNWINVDKREYLCPADFDYGNKFHETVHKDSAPLHALRALLADEWKEDRVLWFGDETSVPENSPLSILRELYSQTVAYGYPGDAFDMMCETYRNVSCLFKEAEERVRQEIGYYLADLESDYDFPTHNEYGIDKNHPFEGLFQRTGKEFRFTLNLAKKIGYSLDETKILYQDNTESDSADPLPILMGYGNNIDPGSWVGDVIGVANQLPEGFALLDKIYLDW